MDKNSEYICPDGSDLASRASARHLRIKAEHAVASGKTVVIDLTDTISISESYADEFFAVLVEQHGLEWFSKNIKLLHQSPNSDQGLLSIATAIRRRLKQQKNINLKSSIDKLISEKEANNLNNCAY